MNKQERVVFLTIVVLGSRRLDVTQDPHTLYVITIYNVIVTVLKSEEPTPQNIDAASISSRKI